jgi:hypothetical protein
MATATLALFISPAAHAVEGTGSIEGRIQDINTGDYLNNARVTIDGTTLSTLTNQFGEYSFAEVPAGEVRVTVFYSGLPMQTTTLTLAPGARATGDFELKSATPAGGVVQLQAYTVKAEHMSEAAFATNEQRFAPNMKTVLEAGSFGHQTDGNLADFLKYVPGLAVNYLAQDANSASVRGMPAHTTIVSFNGGHLPCIFNGLYNGLFSFFQLIEIFDLVNNIADNNFIKIAGCFFSVTGYKRNGRTFGVQIVNISDLLQRKIKCCGYLL